MEDVLRITNGRGADLVVEASGAPSAIASSFSTVRRMGRVCQIGLTGRDEISIPWIKLPGKCVIFFST